MNNENFKKLFNEDHSKAMMASFSKTELPSFRKASKKVKQKMVEERQTQISPELDAAIQRFISDNKSRVHKNQLKEMVKKRFGITVV